MDTLKLAAPSTPPFGGAHGMGEYGSMMGNQAFGGSNGMAFGQQLGAAHTMLNSHAYH